MTESLLDRTNAGLHNQAMMEFGAVQCIPTRPECSVCPFQSYCVALSNHSVNSLPVKTKKNKSKDRFFNYLFLSEKSENNVFTLLQKRTGKDIWKNLYEFPLIESDHCFTDFELLHQREPPVSFSRSRQSHHSFALFFHSTRPFAPKHICPILFYQFNKSASTTWIP